MKLEGKAISHVKFGKGIVKESSEKYITILFPHGEKKFLYPDAFLKFLILKDEKTQEKIDQILDGKLSREEKRREKERKEQEKQQRIQNLKIRQYSQAAFGLSPNNQEQVFERWSVYTGQYLSGKSKGEPKIPTKLDLNSACLITLRRMGEPEKNRKIIGAFMVEDDFDASSCMDGIIRSHDYFRMELKERERLPYWDYFEESEPLKWGRTEMKLITITQMQTILKDMQQKISHSKRKEKMKEFYEYFCFVNRLNNES